MGRSGPACLVVGAGVIGASVAYHLALGGARVTIVDGGRPAGGVSGASFAIDVTAQKTPRAYFDFGCAARDEHQRLQQEIAEVSWLHVCPRLEWAADEAAQVQLRDRLDRLAQWGYPSEWISRERAQEIEPQLGRQREPDTLWAHYPDGAWYELPALVGALLGRAQALGAQLRTGDAMVEYRFDAERVSGCRTRSGAVIAADVVVLCTGAETADLAAGLGVSLSLQRVPGIVGLTQPLGTPLRSIVVGRSGSVRPARGGRALLHSYDVDAMLDEPADENDRRPPRLVEDAGAWAAGLAGCELSEVMLGVRPVPADGLPLLGRIGDGASAYVAVTHSGAHLGPLVGRLVARELLGDEEVKMLRPFRPERAQTGPHPLDEAAHSMMSQLASVRPR